MLGCHIDRGRFFRQTYKTCFGLPDSDVAFCVWMCVRVWVGGSRSLRFTVCGSIYHIHITQERFARILLIETLSSLLRITKSRCKVYMNTMKMDPLAGATIQRLLVKEWHEKRPNGVVVYNAVQEYEFTYLLTKMPTLLPPPVLAALLAKLANSLDIFCPVPVRPWEGGQQECGQSVGVEK